MKAVGINTAQSTKAIAINAPPTSSIVLCTASRGDMPRLINRSAFSTTTIASSTTTPIASTRPKQRKRVEGEAEPAHHQETANQRDRYGDDWDNRGPPCLEKDDNDDDDESGGFVKRMHDLVHRLLDEFGRVVDDRVIET